MNRETPAEDRRPGKILERCQKAEECTVAWDFPEAYWASNAVEFEKLHGFRYHDHW
jgi:hypothetical protein